MGVEDITNRPVVTPTDLTAQRLDWRSSRRFPAMARGEAAIESLVLRRHAQQQLRWRKARPMPGGELFTHGDEADGTHHVDIGQGAAGERREAEAEDRADIGLADVGEDALLEAARRFERLDTEQAILELLHIDGVGVELDLLQVGEPGPQPFLALVGIV